MLGACDEAAAMAAWAAQAVRLERGNDKVANGGVVLND